MGPSMGPLIGGYAATFKGWRWTIWVLMMFSGAAFAWLFAFYPETSASNILYRRAVRLRKATGNPKIKAQSEIDAAEMTFRDIALIGPYHPHYPTTVCVSDFFLLHCSVLVRPITLNFQEPVVLCLNIYIGLIYALLYCWFESFPIVFGEIYRFPEQNQGLAFLGIFIGSLIAIPCYFAYLHCKLLRNSFPCEC